MNLQIVIFTYNRELMLKKLLMHINSAEFYDMDIIVIDDGSDWSKDHKSRPDHVQFFRTPHDGKKGMWRNWLIAHEIALSSEHDYFLFLADDVIPNMEIIKTLTEQSWDNKLFSIAPTNTGRYSEWGNFKTGQKNFVIGDYEFVETGFMDLGMFTNRRTLECLRVNQVPDAWFDRPDKSSGVGRFITQQLRSNAVCMMTSKPSISTHGEHDSVMHYEHRKETPLKSV